MTDNNTPAESCMCEHAQHFDGGDGHAYGTVPAGSRRAVYVGPVCDDCAAGHMASYLRPEPEQPAHEAGLPQSRHGGLHPELAAALTAARAYLADFRAEDEHAKRQPPGAVYVDYRSAAYRLAADLHKILELIERNPS